MASVGLDVEATIGVFYLIIVFTTALWAAGTVQAYFYYDRYSQKDSMRMRIHVAFVYLLDTAHQIVALRSAYETFVKKFGNIIKVNQINKDNFAIAAILTGFVILPVQALFVTRIWSLSNRNIFLTGFITILALGQFGMIMTYAGAIYPIREATQMESVINIERAMLVVIAVGELVISSVITILLHTSRSGFRRTDSVINRLIFYTIASGLITGINAISSLIVSLTLPKAYYYLMFDAIGPKLYVNSMLSFLNSRGKVRDQLDSENVLTSSQLRPSALRMERLEHPAFPVKKSQTPRSSYVDSRFESSSDRTLVLARNKEDA